MNKLRISESAKGAFFLLTSALLYSIMPVLIRLLGSGGVPPVSQVFLRYLFAFLAAFIYFRLSNRKAVAVHKKDLIFLVITTVFGYALTNVFFTIGILNTQVSVALFLFYSYAILAPVAGFLILKDKINKYNVGALFLSFIALLLLYQPTSFTTWKIGALFALLSALGQTVYVILRRILSHYPANFLMLSNTFMGVIVVGLLSFFLEKSFYTGGEVFHLNRNIWLVTVLFGFDNFLAWLAMTKGFEYFKAASGSLILLSELVFGVLFALAFFQEIPTIITLLGGFLIIVSSATVILKGKS